MARARALMVAEPEAQEGGVMAAEAEEAQALQHRRRSGAGDGAAWRAH
jgi:hypothetical protein